MTSISNLSRKQIESFQQSDARINIFEGPVRAGKSFSSIIRFIEFCRSGPPGLLLLAGKSEKTIKNNIIAPLQDLIGSAVQYRSGKGEVYLYDRTMMVCGANDERAEQKIRGSTLAGALLDEATLLPESFFKMLLSRMSIPGAKLFCSTNPDSPYHWLKKEFIDRKEELDCKVFSFNIDDNPSLEDQFKEQLKREYRGLWYKRYIEGLWVVAEGAVYDFFDEKTHVIPYKQANATKYIIGIDYGTTNPCVFLLVGYNKNAFPNMWIEKEYYYDSKVALKQKSDYEYVLDLIQFMSGYAIDTIYVDPSAASLKQEMIRNGVMNVMDADNDVIPGIRFVGQLIANGTLKVCSQCVETIKEFSTYVWDEKASERGEDKPVKKNDHAMDALKYCVYTHFFQTLGCSNMTEREVLDMEKRYSYRLGQSA